MARLQIEANLDGDAMLPGGRTAVHRFSLVLSRDEIHDLANGNPIKLNSALPDLTVKHLFIDIKLDA